MGQCRLAYQVEVACFSAQRRLVYEENRAPKTGLVLSFEPDGQERFIEVKTTGFGERTPFFVSANEARFARAQAARFRLYRLFDFRQSPRLFELPGPIEQHCRPDAVSFRASFA